MRGRFRLCQWTKRTIRPPSPNRLDRLVLRVEWILLCDAIEVDDGIANITGAGIDSYEAASLPLDVKVVMGVMIKGVMDDLQHSVTLSLQGPNPLQVDPPMDPWPLTADSSPNTPEGWESHLLLPFSVGFRATEYGTYIVTASIDNNSESALFRIVRPDA